MARKNLPKLKPGDLVAGRFRIVEIIGSGGFSVVYRAHQEDANRFVALKVLKPTASNDEKIVERFRREALYASHLSHPNTISLYDYGHTDDNLCYIAMEHLSGVDLSAVVQKHIPMDLKRIWRIIVQSCRSLAEAHRLGLVHRDLKPENIFLVQNDDDENVKVLDFGVSKAISSFGDAGPATLAPLTQEGTVFGTPLYMAPEQAMAESITPAVDVYALGHMMFEMVTGYAAYDGSTNAMDVMLKQINDPPLALPDPWQETPFNSLITVCTQKDPTHRLQNAQVLLDRMMDAAFEPYFDPAERPSKTLPMPNIVGTMDPSLTQPLNTEEIEEVYRWELEVLDGIYEECQTQQEPRVVVLRGVPGTGRSNLMRAFIERKVTSDESIVLHRPTSASQSEGLEKELSFLTGTALESSGISEVKRILSNLYGNDFDFDKESADLGSDSRPLGTLTTIRDSLLQHIGQPFRDASDRGTIVWAIENLERVDTLTLAFVDKFFRDLKSTPAPIMFLISVYPEDLERRPGMLRYTESLLQASQPYGRQLNLIPPGELRDGDHSTMPDEPIEGLGSYLGGLPNVAAALDEDEHEPPTERMEVPDDMFPDDQTVPFSTDHLQSEPQDAASAFDRILGYLAQLGDQVPEELWKLVYARIVETEMISMVDAIVQQAEKFGIVAWENGVIYFTKPGYAQLLRDGFESLPDAIEAHKKFGELLEGYFTQPSQDQRKLIADHWRLAGEHARAVLLLANAGDDAFESFDLDAAREYFLQIQKILDQHPGLEIPRPNGGVVKQSEIWLRLGEVHGALGEFGAAEDALQRALAAVDTVDRIATARANKLLGDLAKTQERFDEALKHYEFARDTYRQRGQAQPFVSITTEMGQCALAQGRASMAEELCRQAIEMVPQLKDESLIGRVYRNMGRVLSRRARFEEANEHLERSIAIFEKLEFRSHLVPCLIELGAASYAVGRFDESRNAYERAITLAVGRDAASAHAAKLGMGRAFAAMSDFESSESVIRSALSNATSGQELGRMADAHYHMGDLLFASGNHDAARLQYDQVINIGESIGQIAYIISAKIRKAYVAFADGDEQAVYQFLGAALERSQVSGRAHDELQVRAHLIYSQLLQHGFRARGDTFSSLITAAESSAMSSTAVLCYVLKSDVEAARGAISEAQNMLRFAEIGAAQVGDYALTIPIRRRKQLLAGAEPTVADGYAIASVIPPEVGKRRFTVLPKAADA